MSLPENQVQQNETLWQGDNNVEKDRLKKLAQIRERGIDPYPHRVNRTHTIAEAISAYEAAEAQAPEGQEVARIPVTVVGRIRQHRPMGKMTFGHIEDASGRVQIWLKVDIVGAEILQFFNDDLDLFDYIEVEGTMTRTKTKEVSVLVKGLRLLSKSLSPLPVVKEDTEGNRHGGFTDPEERYRQRYADLAVNPDVRDVFLTRAKTIRALRHFFDNEGFIEVETPILQPIYGGAAARPFTTHHNQLKQELYLRISFELYLKRLLVGGYEGVYEIGRDFRNEGVDRTHNPEFTQIEFYKAYIDYHGVMDITERMMKQVVQEVCGTAMISFQGKEVYFDKPWQRITMRDAIKKYSEIDYMDYPDADSLREAMRESGKKPDPRATWGKLVDSLLGDDVQPNLIQPTFIIEYPRDISPLAKKKPDDDKHVERFEFFIAGMEMGNAFTELNDPLDQEQRFRDMQEMYGTEEEESHPIDDDYLRAMRYGMPPNGGFGMGVDRLVMLLSDRPNIREVLLFPALRQDRSPEQDENNES